MIEALAYPTGDAASSVLCLQKIAPEEVVAGDSFTYELRVTNTTSGTIPEVILTDRLPPGFSMTSAEPMPSGSGPELQWNLGSVGPGDTRTVRVTGVAGGSGDLVNCADVFIPNEICATTRVVQPSLRLTKEGPEQVMLCDTIVYRLIVSNDGTGSARGVVIDDSLPAGLSPVGPTSITVGDLAGGESREFTVSARPDQVGTYTNSATARSDSGLTASSNPVTTNVVQPELTIAMTCSDRRLGLGTFDYTINVSNVGNGVCQNTQVTASIPAGSTFVSASQGGSAGGSMVTWNLGTVEPGQSASMTFTAQATTLGMKTSQANASCVCADTVSAECTVDVQGVPALLLEVVDSPDPVPVGGETTYTITVTNQGTLDGHNIRITCNLENEAEFVSAGGATNGTANGQSITFEPYGALAPGQRITWTVRVRAVGAADTRFHTQMEADELTRPVEETESTNFYQ